MVVPLIARISPLVVVIRRSPIRISPLVSLFAEFVEWHLSMDDQNQTGKKNYQRGKQTRAERAEHGLTVLENRSAGSAQDSGHQDPSSLTSQRRLMPNAWTTERPSDLWSFLPLARRTPASINSSRCSLTLVIDDNSSLLTTGADLFPGVG
jgi:hypothetical protein